MGEQKMISRSGLALFLVCVALAAAAYTKDQCIGINACSDLGSTPVGSYCGVAASGSAMKVCAGVGNCNGADPCSSQKNTLTANGVKNTTIQAMCLEATKMEAAYKSCQSTSTTSAAAIGAAGSSLVFMFTGAAAVMAWVASFSTVAHSNRSGSVQCQGIQGIKPTQVIC